MNIEIPKEELVDINLLKVDEHNPNIMSEEEKKALRYSIEKYGFIIPIITNTDYMIADGQQRWEVAKEMGLEKVKVIRLPLKEVDRRILRQVLNKLRGVHDQDRDLEEFDKILADSGLNELKNMLPSIDVDQILTQLEKKDLGEEEFEPDLDKEPKYKLNIGDVWALGEHRLMCGDSTKKEHVGQLMGSERADMVFTDPPYNVNYSSKNELLNLYSKGNSLQTPLKNDSLTEKEYIDFSNKWFNNLIEYLNDYNSVYICGNYESLIGFYNAQRLIISNILVWVKNNIVLGRMDYKGQHENILYGWVKHHKWYGGNGESTVWKIDKPLSSKFHPTMKPIELIERGLRNSSKENQIVLDIFGGSGSTLIACEKLGRKCYMMEIDPVYCSVIIERWEAFTGKKAKKI